MAKTQRYLATGSRIVVKGTRATKAQWYVTKTDVALPDGEFAGATCPMTGATVNTATKDGFHLYFPSRIVRVRVALEPGDLDDAKLSAFRPVQFSYYIPDSAMDPDAPADKPRRFPNPSDQLRRFAIRTDDGGSVWLMNEGDVPLALMAKMIDAGAVPFVVRLHPDDAKEHVLAGIMALQRQIVAATVSAHESAASATVQLEAATAGGETGAATKMAEKAEKYYAQRAKGIETRLGDLARDLATAAARFGINPDVLHLDGLVSTAGTLRTEMANRAKAYLAAAKTLRATGTTDNVAMANAADRDLVPLDALAGALEDAGDDAGAAALMATRDGAPAAGDDDVFSLADVGDDDAKPAA